MKSNGKRPITPERSSTAPAPVPRLARRRPARGLPGDPAAGGDALVSDGELSGLIGYALRRAQLRVFEDFYAALSVEGITPARFSALCLIDANAGVSQTTLAETLDIARSGVVSLIDNLEKLDLVSREPIATDKRAYALHLTRNGKLTLQRIRRQVAVHEARVCSRLGKKDKQNLLELLSRVGTPG